MLIMRVPGHEDLVAMLTFVGRNAEMAAYMVLHVAELSELFRAQSAVENLVEAA